LNLNGKQVAVNSNSFVNVLPSSNYAKGFAGGQGQFFAVGNGNGGLALTPLASSDVVGRGMDGSLSGVLPVNNGISSSGTGNLNLPSNFEQTVLANVISDTSNQNLSASSTLFQSVYTAVLAGVQILEASGILPGNETFNYDVQDITISTVGWGPGTTTAQLITIAQDQAIGLTSYP
jgi:hypothetical protein